MASTTNHLSTNENDETCFCLVIYSGYLCIQDNRALDEALGFQDIYVKAIQVAVDFNYPATVGTEVDLKWLIWRHISLTKMNVTNNSGWGGGILRDRDLMKMVEISPNLLNCNLDSNIHLTDLSIASLLNSCSNLRELRLNCLVRFTGSGFSMVTNVLPALKKLDLQGCLYVKDEFLAPFTKQVPNLSSIVFGDNQRITDIAISAMATNCKKLEVVRFERMIYVSDESISLLIRNCLQLREIALNAVYNMRHRFEAIRLLDLCPLLQVIIIQTLDDSFEIEDSTIQHVVNFCPLIQQLHMYSEHIHTTSLVTVRSIQAISDRLQRLQCLRLDVVSSTTFPTNLYLLEIERRPVTAFECLVRQCLRLKCADIRRNGCGIGDWFYQLLD